MGEYFTAYCYNPETGYDFAKTQQVQPNLMQNSDFQSYGNFDPVKPTTMQTSQFEQIDGKRKAIVKNPINGEDSVVNWFPETGRTKALGLRLQSNPDYAGVSYYVGMYMRANNWVYTPETQLKAGTVVTMSVYIYNNDDYKHTFSTRTNESNSPNEWNSASGFSVGNDISIESKSWQRLEWQYTLKYNHEGSYSEQGDLGMRVFQKLSGNDKADFIIAMPKIEVGTRATPWRTTTHDEGIIDNWKAQDPVFRPYVGKSLTDSDNWEDYTGWTQVSTESLDNRNADIGYTKAEVHCLSLPEDAGQGIGRQIPKIWVGIDSDTFNVATGRTVQFSQLNRELNFVGHIAENETDNSGAYNYNDSTWVNMGDIMYCSQNGLLIDPVVGEMANLGEDGSQYATGTLCRIDEVARDIVENHGANFPGSWGDISFKKETEGEWRPKSAGLKVASSLHPGASSGASSYIEQVWQYGFTTKPYKIKRFTTDSKWSKAITNFCYNNGVSVFDRSKTAMPDWFRGGNVGDIKPLPQRIMMINMTTKKWWWFDYDKKTGLWVRSAEKDRPRYFSTSVQEWYKHGLPKDGKLKGCVVFTDTNYTDYASNNLPSTIGLDILFPDERKENCYYAPMWHDNNYRSDMCYWGDTAFVRSNFNFNDQKYGAFGVYEINLMSGTMTLRRVWNR